MPPRVVENWNLTVIPREDFARSYFWYEPGEHVVFAGPTQRGKTTLAFKVLEYCVSEDVPAYIIVSKPRDPVTSREAKRLNFRVVDHWPVERQVKEMWDGKPTGYVIWPRFGDVDKDIPRAAAVSRAVLADRYAQGVKGKKGIIVCDDTVIKSKILGLDKEMTTHIAMAGAMDVGSWFFVQKPTGAGNTALWSYGNSEHVFILRDPDRRNRQRYDEIGGVDSKQVEQLSLTLQPYQALYIKRTPDENGNQVMCIVDSK